MSPYLDPEANMNESQCRSFLKTVGVLMLIGLPWVLLRAAAAPDPKVVRATRFVLVDAQGKDVATWSVEQSGEDRGNVRLSMRNVALTATPDGYAALIVGTGGPRTEITASPRSSGIAVWGKDNKLEFTTAK